MEKIDIVAVPFHDWKKNQAEGFRTRDAHLLQEFAHHQSVEKLMIVDRPISLSEMILRQRPWKFQGGRETYSNKFRSLRQIEDKVYILDILYPELIRPILMRHRWISFAFSRPETKNYLQDALTYLGISKPIFYMSSPLPIPLYMHFHDAFLAFDAVDNLTKIPMFAPMLDEIKSYYEFARIHAQVIFTNSMKTAIWLGEGRQNVVFISNGVDWRHFKSSNGQIPDDLASVPKPIVGYAGKMQEMFAIEIMQYAVEHLPDVSFVLIGQQLNPGWMQPLWKHKNVYYLGDKHYRVLPEYLANFDICVVPYSVERQHDVDPIKFYEYLSMEKPVVSTIIGNVSEYSHFPNVLLANDPIGFTNALRVFLADIRSGKKIQTGSLPETVLWPNKADQMITIIKNLLN